MNQKGNAQASTLYSWWLTSQLDANSACQQFVLLFAGGQLTHEHVQPRQHFV
jgi:hypothetical protein